jgi:hypothetical protein
MITGSDIDRLLTYNTFRSESEIEDYLFHMCNEWKTYNEMYIDLYENDEWHMPNYL